MGTVTPIRDNVLPAPFNVYQRKGFIECKSNEADGWIEHTETGDKRYWLISRRGILQICRWATAQEYLQVMEGKSNG